MPCRRSRATSSCSSLTLGAVDRSKAIEAPPVYTCRQVRVVSTGDKYIRVDCGGYPSGRQRSSLCGGYGDKFVPNPPSTPSRSDLGSTWSAGLRWAVACVSPAPADREV